MNTIHAIYNVMNDIRARVQTIASQAWTIVITQATSLLHTARTNASIAFAQIPHVKIIVDVKAIAKDVRVNSALLVIAAVAFILLTPTSGLSGKMPERAEDVARVTTRFKAAVPVKYGLPTVEEFPKPKVVKTMTVSATAYNSLPSQTDGDPFTTASGSKTHNGTVAGCFPFGTQLEIIDPKTGESLNGITYTVEDRTAKNTCNHIDIWMETLHDAKQWGRRTVEIRIIEPVDYTVAAK